MRRPGFSVISPSVMTNSLGIMRFDRQLASQPADPGSPGQVAGMKRVARDKKSLLGQQKDLILPYQENRAS